MNNMTPNLDKIIKDTIKDHLLVSENLLSTQTNKILQITKILKKTMKENGTIFWCGNGGCAADSQHLNAELIGRFEKERKPIRSMALTTDTSVLTALANDYSFDQIFSRQINAYCKKIDSVIFISTSGNSMNLINGLKEAKKKGCKTISLLGKNGGKIKKFSDISLVVSSNNTARIQEMHILIGHIICLILEMNKK